MGRKNQALINAGGISGLAGSLRRVADKELSDEMKAASLAAAKVLVPLAVAAAPKGETGNLKKSIKPAATRRYARIVAGTPKRVPYARAIHSGRYYKSTGKRTKGQPYIRSSIPKAFPKLVDEYVKSMNKIAARFEKKHGVHQVKGRYSRR